MIGKNLLFSDETYEYRDPVEPEEYDTVKLKFRTGINDIHKVNIKVNNDTIPMIKTQGDSLFDYYETSLSLRDKSVSYYFEIMKEDEICYYNKLGTLDEINTMYNFIITPGFKTPDWAKGAVFYQIFVERFYNGDLANDVLDKEYIYINECVTKVTDWNKVPDAVGMREFYGGDLLGVIKKLDYLKELGVDVIYLNPIFVSPSNHKYDTQDYDYVDPHYGVIVEDSGEVLSSNLDGNKHATKYKKRATDKKNLEASNELFLRLVEEIHKRDMKVILDGVFNHCGSFNKWLDREELYDEKNGYEIGAYRERKSPYKDYFKFNEDAWPNNTSYNGWWGHDTLPKLNYEGSRKLYEYILEVAKKWVSPPYNCDGWRLDVAADLGLSEEFNHQFYKDFRKEVKSVNPDVFILAEHYGDPKQWLLGDEWDTVMNYDAFMEPVSWFLTGLEKHSDEFREDMVGKADIFFNGMKHHMSKFQTSSLQVAMNQLSNHDHSRFLTRTNKKVGRLSTLGSSAASEGINKGIFREAVVMQMTWPGAPTIYYGDEAGVCGFTDPDNRRTYPWGMEDVELISFHKDIIEIHKSYKVLKKGSLLFLTGDSGFISYGRFDRDDKFIIAINNNSYDIEVLIPAMNIGVLEEEILVSLIMTFEAGYNTEGVIYRTQDGMLKLTLPPISSIVLKNKVEKV